jgi:hypothetical protein
MSFHVVFMVGGLLSVKVEGKLTIVLNFRSEKKIGEFCGGAIRLC